jgi:hypothetical protein
MSALAAYVAEIARQLDLLRSAEERDSLALRYVHGLEQPVRGNRRIWTRRDKRYSGWQQIAKRQRPPVPVRRVGRMVRRIQPDNRENAARNLHRLALSEAQRAGTFDKVAGALEEMAAVHDEC